MDVLHVHFEVVVPGELLVAQLALGHGPVGVVGQFVPAEHLLQAERQVAHLGDRTHSVFSPNPTLYTFYDPDFLHLRLQWSSLT